MKKNLSLLILCFLSALCLWLAQIRRDQLTLARHIAPQILRFHVIANSNTPEDQEIKLKVKSYLLEHIYQEFYLQTCPQTNATDIAFQNAPEQDLPEKNSSEENAPEKNHEKEDLKSFLLTHREDLERDAENYIRHLGRSYPVSLDVAWCEFPEKIYGNLCLPAGTYEAAQVKIGSARGHNWWCVLYPKVCITKDAVATVPDSSLEELSQILSPEDYQKLLLERPALMPTIHFSFLGLERMKHLPHILRQLP